MRTEVHVHGSLYLRKGVTLSQIEAGLRQWMEYLDAESISEMRSLEPSEPGVSYDQSARVLDICWTGEVGRTFQRSLQATLVDMGPLLEQASEVEITFYHEDGRDEFQLLFAGPSAEAIHQVQRRLMLTDVSSLLSRHFGTEEVKRVEALVNELFDRDWEQKGAQAQAEADFQPSGSLIHFRGKKHLH
ncbi:MAG: hypothetical protein Q8K43_04240 [Sulfurimicrobium sp.]|nr:hypothetical protein [Sulfurimicrobium sp.]